MGLVTGFLRTLVLLGAFQGFILSALLYFSKCRGLSERLLAVLIFLMALANLNLYLLDETWFSRSQILVLLSYVTPMVIIMPFGPLIYFYIRAYSDEGFQFKRKYGIHFLPVLIDLIPYITAIIYISGVLLHWISKNDPPWGNFIDTVNVYSDIPRWISVSTYLYVSWRYIRSIQKKPAPAKKTVSLSDPWLKQFILVFTVFQVIWFFFLIPYIIPRYSNRLLDTLGWYPVYIPLSVLIYWLGIKGWMASSARARQEKIKIKSGMPVTDQDQELIRRLKGAMEEDKVWLDPGLNLSLLSKHTGISPKVISALLNQSLQSSFSEFVNGYRIDAVKQRLIAAEDKNLTIAGLAYECGFNSQPTFQRAFKSIQGESPSEFLARH